MAKWSDGWWLMGVEVTMGKPKVLVTGATSGIGLETAVLLAENGYEVIATGRTEEKMSRIHKRAENSHVAIQTAYVDVANAESVANLKNEVLTLTDGYGIDILVNNAALHYENKELSDLTEKEMQRTFETNIISFFRLTKAALPRKC